MIASFLTVVLAQVQRVQTLLLVAPPPDDTGINDSLLSLASHVGGFASGILAVFAAFFGIAYFTVDSSHKNAMLKGFLVTAIIGTFLMVLATPASKTFISWLFPK